MLDLKKYSYILLLLFLIFHARTILPVFLVRAPPIGLMHCVQFMRVNHGGKLHGETHKWLEDTVNSFSHLTSASKAGFETIHMLRMSLLTVQRPLFHTERIPQIYILLVI